MKKNLKKQYNPIVKEFTLQRKKFNKFSDIRFGACTILISKVCTHALDLGCGDGKDMLSGQFSHMKYCGVDSSSKMVKIARKNTGADIRCEDFAKTSFANESFDLITSKWAMQTSSEIEPIYSEVYRLLKHGGYFVFLVVHPMRQFIEKKKQGKNYWEKEIVDSILFKGTLTVKEPTHTLEEYLSQEFLRKFSLLRIEEGAEFPAAEQIGGDTYPTFLIIVAQKK